MITCVKVVKETVFVLSVYDKSESESISDDEIASRLADANV